MTHVVIVDDQPEFRRRLCQMLTLAGLHVIGEAEDIPSAELIVQTQQPDLAIVDVVLPRINGLEGTKQLKAICPRLKVILVSAYLDRAQVFRSAAHDAGAEAFISKDELDLELLRTWNA